MTSTVTATFKTRAAAESVLRSLENIGIKDEQISLVLTDDTRGKSFNLEKGTKIDEGTAAGAVAGGIVGGILAAVTAATAVVIPGMNLVIVGTLVSATAGIGAGATAGGLIGALIGAGIPEYEAKIYENEVKSGAILLAVKPENGDQHKQVKQIFEREDAYHLAA